MAETVITCISDDETFADRVYGYLLSELERHSQLNEGKNFRISADLIKLIQPDNEIHMEQSAQIPTSLIKGILQSFLKQDSAKYKGYDVIEFGGQFTIGRVLHPSEMDMFTCEICGFFTPYSEELQTHRMTHFGIG